VKIDLAKAVLLVMDVQNDMVRRFLPSDPQFLVRLSGVIQHARAAAIPVLYIVVEFRPGLPEVVDRGYFADVKKSGKLISGTPEVMVHPAIAPKTNDIIVTKRRISSFAGSDLEVVLRGLNRDLLILTGISTSGVVLSTYREAFDKDYSLVVIADACVDNDQEVHRVLVEKIFPRHGIVLTAAEFAQAIR